MRHPVISLKIPILAIVAIVMTGVLLPFESYAAQTHEVAILKGSTTLGDKSYAPNPVEIAKGDTIRFVNEDSVLHTASSGDGASAILSGVFDSGFLGPNRSAEVIVNEVGEFEYYCQAHPTMVGLVKVSESVNTGNNLFRTIAVHDGLEYEVQSSSASTAKATQAKINSGVSVEVFVEGSGEVDLTFPTSMIEGISSITTSSGQSVTFSKVAESESATTVRFSVPDGDGTVVVMGSRVVPEFQTLVTVLILSSVVATMIISGRFIRTSGFKFI
jgi:plastocyanin